jgi:hypothetical protein
VKGKEGQAGRQRMMIVSIILVPYLSLTLFMNVILPIACISIGFLSRHCM